MTSHRTRLTLRTLALSTGLALVVLGGHGAARQPPCLGVVDFTDDPDAPVEGTLRHWVERRARPGDTIAFCRRGVVMLREPLVVRKAGIRIAGPAELRETGRFDAKVIVRGTGVRLEGLVFTDVEVLLEADGATLTRSTVTSRRADQPAMTVGAPGHGRALEGIVIGGGDGDGNTITGAENGISLFRADRARVTHNTVAGGISDDLSKRALIGDNTITGGIVLESWAAQVLRNRLQGTGRLVSYPAGESRAPLRIADNVLTGGPNILVGHANAVVTGNTVSDPGADVASSGIVVGCIPAAFDGDVLIRGNTVERAGNGVVIGCQRVQPDVEVSVNRIVESRRDGIVVGGASLDVRGNEVTGGGRHGIRVDERTRPASLRANTVSGVRGDGIHFEKLARGHVARGAIHGNGRAGVFVDAGAQVRVSRTAFRENGGAGIDIAPRGVTPNRRTKVANRNIDWPDPPRWDAARKRVGNAARIGGRACAGCLIEAFQREDGVRAGNPLNGEGAAYAGATRADAKGRWRYPSKGTIDCVDAERLTFTATDDRKRSARTRAKGPRAVAAAARRGTVTSEFSPDVECGADAPQVDPPKPDQNVVPQPDQQDGPPAGAEPPDGGAPPPATPAALTDASFEHAGFPSEACIRATGTPGATVRLTLSHAAPGAVEPPAEITKTLVDDGSGRGVADFTWKITQDDTTYSVGGTVGDQPVTGTIAVGPSPSPGPRPCPDP